MPRNRYLNLMKFLHFVNNYHLDQNVHGADRKIAKIAPIIDYVNKKFRQLYTPERAISVDESLLLWKGRLSWVQYIRSKVARFGIKTYELCEAKQDIF
ncbi:unnamed protein product [Parnassius mnemosyne]|uniref:PiggyBac transposable element-derived protein domain-containing protein n=1 Tax=Parnassius mnemosyne TaxID=213953 RepID=A0AAV1LNC4_9NEOP